MSKKIERFSNLTCPACGHETREEMPVDACQFFYECTACGELLRPRRGDCCVFCSYGDVACPPIQQQDEGCRSAKSRAGDGDG